MGIFDLIEKRKEDDALALLAQNPELVTQANDNGNTPLHHAMGGGMLRLVKHLVENGAKVNAQNRPRQTPLHIAIIQGTAGEVALLLEHGADYSIQDDTGFTPWTLAQKLGRPEIRAALDLGIRKQMQRTDEMMRRAVSGNPGAAASPSRWTSKSDSK